MKISYGVMGNLLLLNPNWNTLKANISRKYQAIYSDLISPSIQLDFYKRSKNGLEFSRMIENLLKKAPPKVGGKSFSNSIGGKAVYGDDAWGLNVVAWDVFEFTNDKVILSKALSWSEIIDRIR